MEERFSKNFEIVWDVSMLSFPVRYVKYHFFGSLKYTQSVMHRFLYRNSMLHALPGSFAPPPKGLLVL